MKITVYNKLVRDNIPEIVTSEGNIPHTVLLDDREYRNQLIKKFSEELQEYVRSGSIEELADILEVFLSLIALDGYSLSAVEEKRVAKKQERGGFDKRVFLCSVDNPVK